MKNIDWKQAIISIIIGAMVAALTVIFEGALEYLGNLENNLAGGAVSSVWYSIKRIV